MTSCSPSTASVSAVVVAHDEGDALARTVHALLGTLPEDGEVIVVDDDSGDAAPASLAAVYPSVRVVRPRGRVGPAVARNIGARAATSEVIVFCVGHITPPMDWIGPMADALRAPDVGAVGPAVAVAGKEAARGYG